MNLLIVDNNLHLPFYNQPAMVRLAIGQVGQVKVRTVRADRLVDRDLDSDAVILTGSTAYVRQETEWMVSERKAIDKWAARKTPVLAICFGAQLVARHFFGPESVGALPAPVFGSVRVRYRDGESLFAGLPNPFGAVATHYEGFSPPEESITSGCDEWPAYSFKHLSFAGLQFHPELMGAAGRLLVRVQKFIFDRHVYLDLSIPSSASDGRKIFRNFINSAADRHGPAKR